MRKLRSLKTKKSVTVCYARNGHRLYEGPVSLAPDHIKDYYIVFTLVRKQKIYVEVVEDKEWLL